jgi:hypothetical protein
MLQLYLGEVWQETKQVAGRRFLSRGLVVAGGTYIGLLAMCPITAGGPWQGRKHPPGNRTGSSTTARSGHGRVQASEPTR